LEASVTLELVVLVAVAIWAAVLLLAISLCRAAKLSDEVMHFVVLRTQAGDRDDEATPSPLPSRSPASSSSRAPEPERPLRTLDLEDAASLLGVSPETLLRWEERFGFPSSCPSECRYSQSEVLALLASLDDGASISAAVAQARERIKRRRASATGGLFDHRDGGLAS
jgi:hypothetical protein